MLEEKAEKLKTLTRRETQVLHYYFRESGFAVSDIMRDFDRREKTIRVYVTAIYNKLGVPEDIDDNSKKKWVIEQYKEAYQYVFKREEWEAEQKIKRAEEERLESERLGRERLEREEEERKLRVEQERMRRLEEERLAKELEAHRVAAQKELEEKQARERPKEKPTIFNPPPQPRATRNLTPILIALGTLLIASMVLVVIVWLADNNHQQSLAATQSAATEQAAAVSTQRAAAISKAVEATSQAVEATSQAVVDLLPTPEPTQGFETAVPEPPQTEPAIPPTPAPIPERILFSDQFDNPIPTEYLRYGTPSNAKGLLASDDVLRLVIGDDSWVNYRIFTRILIAPCSFSPEDGDRDSIISVRYSNHRSAFGYVWPACENAEYLERDVEIVVSGDTVTTWVDGYEYKSIWLPPEISRGGIYLELDRASALDNLLVVGLP